MKAGTKHTKESRGKQSRSRISSWKKKREESGELILTTSKNAFYVYVVTDPSGKQYVGMTKNYKGRWSSHLLNASRTKTSRATIGLYSMIQKYGKEKISFRVVAVFQTREEGFRVEQELIRKWGTLSPNGYNLQSGGVHFESSEPLIKHLKSTWTNERKKKASETFTGERNPQFGKKATPELRKQLSESHKGIIRSNEWCHNLSEALIGRKFSIEHRKHISEAKKGKTQTEEHKEKNSQANLGEKNHMFGKHHTEKTKALLRQINLGRTQSEETKKKIGLAGISRKHTNKTKCKMAKARRLYWKHKKEIK